MVYRRILTIIFSLVFIIGCNQGLSPDESVVGQGPSGIAGTLRFTNWPPPDSLFDLRVVVFKVFPPTDILSALLTGQAFAFPPIDSLPLPFYVDSLIYQVELPPGTYEAVTVVYRYGPLILSDWALVGVYHRPDAPSDTIPDKVKVFPGQLTPNIDIQVNFRRHIAITQGSAPQ